MKERNNPWMKRLDKWIGCPILFVLGIFHHNRKAIDLNTIDTPKIAMIKTAAIGDTIVLSAMVDEIKRQYPRSSITVICSNNNLSMVKLIRGVDDIFVFEMKRPLQSFPALRGLGHFDLLLDFGPWPRINAVISWMVHVDYKVGFKRAHMYRHYVYDKWVEHLDSVHEIDNYRNILRAANLKVAGFLPSFSPTAERPVDGAYVVFHQYPGGAMERQRMWQEGKWRELGRQMFRKYQMPILLSGSRDNAGAAEAMADELKASGVNAVSIAGKYSLKEMIDILAHAKLVVSVNTGIMHLASAVHVPLVALHGPTSEKRWGPLSECSVVVKTGEPCQPCISLGFESNCRNPMCMEHITVDMVIKEIDSHMSNSTRVGSPL